MRTINSPNGARARLVAVLAVVVAATLFDGGTRGRTVRVEPQRDVELFRAVVAEMNAGSSYYEAMGSELRQRRYPSTSVFNWRTLLLYRTLALGPLAAARTALLAAAIALWVLTVLVIRRHSTLALIVAAVIQLGAVIAVAVPPAVLLTEAWSGVIIGLSFCAFRLRRWRTGVGLGILALFIRELAAPYVAVCALIAIRKRRWNEVVGWTVAAMVYFASFARHLITVRALHQPGDLSQASSWLFWGGPAFFVQTLRTNAWLYVAPSWLPLAAVLLGLLAASWHSGAPLRLRAVTLAYLAMFLAVGQPFNSYWGLVTAPLWAFAAAAGVDALQTWWLTVFSGETRLIGMNRRLVEQRAQSGRHAYD